MAKSNYSLTTRATAVSGAILALVLTYKPGHDGDIGLGLTSGPVSKGQNLIDVASKKSLHHIKLATLPFFQTSVPVEQVVKKTTTVPALTPAPEKKELKIAPVARPEPVLVKSTPVNDTPMNPVVQGSKDEPSKIKRKPIFASAETKGGAVVGRESASFVPPKQNEAFSSVFRGATGSEKVYQIVVDSPAYCMENIKPGQNCPEYSYVDAQIHTTHFILTKTAQVTPDQAKIIIVAATSNDDLNKAGIIVVQDDKHDQMGNLLLSVVYSNGGSTSTWYDPATHVPTQRHIAFKDKPLVEEQYAASTGKWVALKPLDAGKNADLRIGSPASTLTAGME